MIDVFLRLLVVLSIPVIGAGCIFLLFSIVYFFASIFETKDLFFFMRKFAFRNMLKERNYQNVTGLLDTLFDTKKECWSFSEEKMIFTLDDVYSVEFFSLHYKKGLRILYNRVEVADIDYEEGKFSYYNIKEEPSNTFSKELFSYLEDLYKELKVENEQKEKEKAREIAAQQEKTAEEKANAAAVLLKKMINELKPFESFTYGDFSVSFTNQKNYKACQFYYKKELYFEAFCNSKQGNFSTEFKNTDKEDARIFKLAEKELNAFVYEILILSKEPAQKDTLPSIHGSVQSISEVIEELLLDEKWLSFEEVHKLKETFPNDLHELITIYQELDLKENVKKEVMESLEVISKNLSSMKETIENNKEQQILQRAEVIRRR